MRKARLERGQILPLVAVALVALLGVSAFAIDVGFAYYAKRQLQAATDAAALAGAQDLPDMATATKTAADYALANTPPNLTAMTFTYKFTCTNVSILATGCNAATTPNNLTVSGTATTDTWFAGLFGIKHFNVTAHANACSPCSSTPVDVMVVIDRTGSMCQDPQGNQDCTDMNNAKDGVRALLGILNPPYAQIGMVAFPPVQTTASDVCGDPYNTSNNGWNGYDAAGRGYLTDALNGSYKTSAGDPNYSSGLYLHTVDGSRPSSGCVESGGSTSYTEALKQAKAELVKDGRPKVPQFIVFMTDGEANLGSVYAKTGGSFPVGNKDDQQPCQSAIDLAGGYKTAGVTIYTIGYALGQKNCTAGQFGKEDSNGRNFPQPCTPFSTGCEHYQGNPKDSGDWETGPITSYTTLSQIASPGKFYAVAGDLTPVFAAIATDISSGASRLVDDGY